MLIFHRGKRYLPAFVISCHLLIYLNSCLQLARGREAQVDHMGCGCASWSTKIAQHKCAPPYQADGDGNQRRRDGSLRASPSQVHKGRRVKKKKNWNAKQGVYISASFPPKKVDVSCNMYVHLNLMNEVTKKQKCAYHQCLLSIVHYSSTTT